MKRSLAGSACLSALLLLAACSQDSTNGGGDGGPPPSSSRPGIGSSTDNPVGTPYTLPTGVELEKPTKGHDQYCVPDNQTENEIKGSGGMVRLCLNFRNTTQQPITVVFPPGLVFISNSVLTQNGIIIQRVTIEVPAGRTQFYVPIYLYCLNLHRKPTNGPEDTYTVGPVTQDSALLELTGLLENKQVPLMDNANGDVQAAVWDVTDGSGLTPADRDHLNKL